MGMESSKNFIPHGRSWILLSFFCTLIKDFICPFRKLLTKQFSNIITWNRRYKLKAASDFLVLSYLLVDKFYKIIFRGLQK